MTDAYDIVNNQMSVVCDTANSTLFHRFLISLINLFYVNSIICFSKHIFHSDRI